MAVVPIHSPTTPIEAPVKLKVYTRKDLDHIPQLQGLSHEQRQLMKAVSAVLPFRINDYVVESLIDWSNIPDDPMFQLTFPQPGMLQASDLDRMLNLVKRDVAPGELQAAARQIQNKLNPHPAGQRELNVPTSTNVYCRGCSTSTARRCCSSPRLVRPAMPTAPTASDGRSSLESTS